jgi:formate hydrogenlyase transcriptional activator
LQTDEYASRGSKNAEVYCIADYRQGRAVRRSDREDKLGEPRHEPKSTRKERLIFSNEIDSSWICEEVIGASKALQQALEHVSDVAQTECTVLISGESGTRKDLVAHAIHRLSHRSPQAFIRVNCAEIPPPLITSELVGQHRGSHSPGTQPRPGRFQLAEGGTIFLDGIGDLSAEAQLAFLQVLEELECEDAADPRPNRLNARLIAGTDVDLQAAGAAGKFRHDLLYRLNVFPIRIPALRERPEDIPILVRHFLSCYARIAGLNPHTMSQRTMELLQSYSWPGDVRELQNVLERFVTLCEAECFSVDVKWISWDAIAARTAGRSTSAELAPDDNDILEAALMEMLATLPGWGAEGRWNEESICDV